MQTLGGLLVSPVLAFYQRFLRLSLRFFLLMFMDFPSTFRIITKFSELGCGFLLLGYVSPLFNFLGLLLIFLFCLRVLRVAKNGAADSGSNSEDQVFDVMSLRRMVKAERQRYHAACAEIEKERGAAASAAEEAMAMILRLQSEKSAVEIQAKQFRRVVEQRQEYDQEVMESLRWTAEQVESQKNLLERQLEALRERLAQFLNEHEIEHLREQQEERIEEEEEERIAEEEEEVRIAEEEEVVRIAEEEEVRIAEEERIEEEEGGGGGGGGGVEEEEEEGTATRTASVIGDDDDSSGFLNFSVELDVEVSSQTQSPTCIRTEQDHL